MDISFSYVGRDGVETARYVIAEAINLTHLQAFDVPSGETRTFRLDGIKHGQVLEVETQKVIFISDLQDFLPELIVVPSRPRRGKCIHFTGFLESKKLEFAQMVSEFKPKFKVVKSITGNLTYLVYNVDRAKPSEKKIEKARLQGVKILTEEEFLNWLKK